MSEPEDDHRYVTEVRRVAGLISVVDQLVSRMIYENADALAGAMARLYPGYFAVRPPVPEPVPPDEPHSADDGVGSPA